MIALIEAYRAGLLKAKNWWQNIIAGLIVGVVALPFRNGAALETVPRPDIP